VRLDVPNDVPVVLHPVERLVGQVEAALRHRLQPKEQLLAPAAGSEFEELVVAAGVDARLAAPPLAVRGDGAEELLAVLDIGGDVVVPEDDHLAGEGAVLPSDLLHRSPSQAARVHLDDRAELTLARATPGREHDAAGMVLAMEQVLARLGNAHERWWCAARISRDVPALLELAQEPWPGVLHLADKYRVGVLLGLVGEQRHMRAAEHHRRSPVAEPVGQRIGMRRARSVERDPHQVVVPSEVHVLDLFVHVLDVPIRRRECGQIGHGALLEVNDS
jgi:hypothetical protein